MGAPDSPALPSRDELNDAQLVLLRTVRWLETHDMTGEEYDRIRLHLHSNVHMIDLERAEWLLDAIGRAMHPDDDGNADDADDKADELSQFRQCGHLRLV